MDEKRLNDVRVISENGAKGRDVCLVLTGHTLPPSIGRTSQQTRGEIRFRTRSHGFISYSKEYENHSDMLLSIKYKYMHWLHGY